MESHKPGLLRPDIEVKESPRQVSRASMYVQLYISYYQELVTTLLNTYLGNLRRHCSTLQEIHILHSAQY